GQYVVCTSTNGQFLGDVKGGVDGHIVPLQVAVGHDPILVEAGVCNPIGGVFAASGHRNTGRGGHGGLKEIDQFAVGGHPRGGLHIVGRSLIKGVPLINQQIGVKGGTIGPVGRCRGHPVQHSVAIDV